MHSYFTLLRGTFIMQQFLLSYFYFAEYILSHGYYKILQKMPLLREKEL